MSRVEGPECQDFDERQAGRLVAVGTKIGGDERPGSLRAFSILKSDFRARVGKFFW